GGTGLGKSAMVNDTSFGGVFLSTLPDTVSGPATPIVRLVIPAPVAPGWTWVLATVGTSGLSAFAIDSLSVAYGPFVPTEPLIVSGEQAILADVDPDTRDLWFSTECSNRAMGVSFTRSAVTSLDSAGLRNNT